MNSSGEFFSQRDDDACRASHIAEFVHLLVLRNLADQFGALGSQTSNRVVDAFDCKHHAPEAQHVQFSFGYNLEIGDDCWIHRHVLLDDRGGITLHDGTSISDYANIYSHTHDIVNQRDISNRRTEIGPRARITYHATVLAGTNVGPDAMLGAFALATRDVPPHTLSLGIPAKPKRQK